MVDYIRKNNGVVNTNRADYLRAKAERQKHKELQSMLDRINTLEQQVKELMEIVNERHSTTNC